MGELSPIHWIIVIGIIVLLFGGKRIPEVMRGMGEGVRNFKEGMRGADTPPGTPVATTAVVTTPVVAIPDPHVTQLPPAETTTVVTEKK